MVDIHCHILPGLDDGPETLEESLQMAHAAMADGITHVVATPHANDAYAFDPELVRTRHAELQNRIGGKLRLTTGCDFHLSFENLEALRRDSGSFTISQKNYLLVEFADFAIPPTIEVTLEEIVARGIHPVVTHPERNPLLASHRERVEAWVRRGCYVQVTAQSLLGRFGPRARRAAEWWLDAGSIHFFASDAHNLTTRPPRLLQAYEAVAERKGEAVARALFCENPLAAFEGRPLPRSPEPAPASRFGGRPRRKRFFFF